MTEYARDGYPALSKLIQDSEREEQARLYPDRPKYEDDYSYFVDYNEGASMAPPSSAPSSSGNTSFGNVQQPTDLNQKRHDLDMIAQRKMELEQQKQAMIQRMRELEQAKADKARQDEAKKAAAEQAAQREDKAKKEAIAQAQAERKLLKQSDSKKSLKPSCVNKRNSVNWKSSAEKLKKPLAKQNVKDLQRCSKPRLCE